MANNEKKSAFNAPAIGVSYKVPKGYVEKIDKDGLVHFVPKKKGTTEKKTEKK